MGKIFLLGRTDYLLNAGSALAKIGIPIGAVATCSAEHAEIEKYKNFAKSVDAKFFLFENKAALSKFCKEFDFSEFDLGVSINWLTVLKNEFLAKFPLGVLNAHLGDLPRYRGNACPNWAILNGESKVALTIHKMTEELDAGPILAKEFFELDEHTDIGTIYQWFDQTLPEMYVRVILGYTSGSLVPVQQSLLPADALRCFPRQPEDALIPWGVSAEGVLRLIRASSRPFAGAFSYLNGKEKVRVWKAAPYNFESQFCAVPGQVCFGDNGDPVIACANGLLRLLDVDVEGVPSGDGKKYILKSLRNRLGSERTIKNI